MEQAEFQEIVSAEANLAAKPLEQIAQAASETQTADAQPAVTETGAAPVTETSANE